MAKSGKKRKNPLQTRVLLGIFLGTLAILFAVALIAYLQNDNWRTPPAELILSMGRLNYYAAAGTVAVLGVLGGWLIPVVLGALSVRLFLGRPFPVARPRPLLLAVGGVLLACSFAALPGGDLSAGRMLIAGSVGTGIVQALRVLFGAVGATVVLVGTAIAYLTTIGIPVLEPIGRIGAPLVAVTRKLRDFVIRSLASIRDAFHSDHRPKQGRLPRRDEEPVEAGGEVLIIENNARNPKPEDWVGPAAKEIPVPAAPVKKAAVVLPSPSEPVDTGASDPDADPDSPTEIPKEVPLVVLPSRGEPEVPPPPREVSSLEMIQEIQTDPTEPYQSPPVHFLERDEGEDGQEREEILADAKVLEKALRDFGVKGKVTQVQPGPVITRYEIEPAPGQKVAPIASLSDDLALALRARSIRVVAPIPGKAAVGIEVPNHNPKVVRLGALLESKEYVDDDSPLNIAIGRSISGEPYCAALNRMPHLLVAGATGAGKSVCINTIITSLVYRAGPEDVRFIMVDPKMLELTTYLGLPHLIPPVVSQPKDAVRILKWAVGEMETRYRTLAHIGVRSIDDYNERQLREGAPKLPYLVVIVDELADLMLSNVRGEIEESIARLAQMARAVGIHLVVATQRPSVDVITGVIKANFPSRIAFQVPTRTDSRTILDSIGAERLLGKGDMLYLGVGMSAPVRIHGSFISTEETTDIVEWLKARNPHVTTPEDEMPLEEVNEMFPRDREDDLFEEASRILVHHQQGSISLLQRRLKVGYARAARLVDMMEEAGIVGPFTGSKAREILVPNLEELDRKLASAKGAPLGGEARS